MNVRDDAVAPAQFRPNWGRERGVVSVDRFVQLQSQPARGGGVGSIAAAVVAVAVAVRAAGRVGLLQGSAPNGRGGGAGECMHVCEGFPHVTLKTTAPGRTPNARTHAHVLS